MDRGKLLDKVEKVIQNSEYSDGKMHVTKKSRQTFIDGKKPDIGKANSICLGGYKEYKKLIKELKEKVPEARFKEDN